jgi:hypothetical protein
MTFVHEHRDRFAVALLLRVLNIAESTYYQWIKQAEQPCERDLVDLGLISNIYEIWETSGFTYGSDRVHRQLRRDGIRVGRKRVERLMPVRAGTGRSCGVAGAAAPRSRTRGTRRPRIWSTGTSPQPARTGSGSLTPPGSRAGRACSGWPPSEMSSRDGSSGGRPPTGATPI